MSTQFVIYDTSAVNRIIYTRFLSGFISRANTSRAAQIRFRTLSDVRGPCLALLRIKITFISRAEWRIARIRDCSLDWRWLELILDHTWRVLHNDANGANNFLLTLIVWIDNHHVCTHTFKCRWRTRAPLLRRRSTLYSRHAIRLVANHKKI